jgi:hypothetical protein
LPPDMMSPHVLALVHLAARYGPLRLTPRCLAP